MSTVSVDDRGRIYLPKDLRSTFGDEFRLVKLKNGVKLIPIEKDPVEGLKKAIGVEDIDISSISDEVDEKARKEIKGDI